VSPQYLQAHDPLAETATGGHYIGARLPEDLAPRIDALNLHTYSFYNNAVGQRVGVHPEHPGSSMNGELALSTYTLRTIESYAALCLPSIKGVL
jgi:hypothetical protein